MASNLSNKISRCITFAHQKEGTSRTIACLNIARWLAKLRQKVLVVDLDPQANATERLGIDPNIVKASMSDVLLDGGKMDDIILETHPNIYLAPATPSLLQAETNLMHFSAPIDLLKCSLMQVSHYFNFILIDSSSHSAFLMANAIIAAENIIVPFDYGIFFLETFNTLKKLLLELEKELNIDINIIVTIIKTYAPFLSCSFLNKKIKNNVMKLLSTWGHPVYNVFTVPFSQKIFLAQMQGMPISHYAYNENLNSIHKRIARAIINKNEYTNEY